MDPLLEKVINYLEAQVDLGTPMGVEAMKSLLDQIDSSRKCTIAFRFAPVEWDQFRNRTVDVVKTLNSYPILMLDPKSKQDLGTLNCVSRFAYSSMNPFMADMLSVADQVRFAINEWYTGLSAGVLEKATVQFQVPDKKFHGIISTFALLAQDIITGEIDWKEETGYDDFIKILEKTFNDLGIEYVRDDLFHDSVIQLMTLVGFLQPIAEKLVITIG